MSKCPKCGAPMDGATCDYCGYTQQATAVSSVAAKNTTNAAAVAVTQFIINNTSPTAAPAAISPKSRWFALAICYFLGFFGVHYFYVGKVGKGILYLFTVGLFGVGWIIDLIRIATGKFTDSNDLPLKK